MCGTIRKNGVSYPYASQLSYETLGGKKLGTWGLGTGKVYNARIENLNTPFWSPIQGNRGIITVDSFIEKGKEFKLEKPMILPVLFNKFEEFVVITRESVGDVLKVHNRMPVVIEDPKAWLEKGEFKEVNYLHLKQQAA